MANPSSTETVNVGALSNALAVAIQQATDGGGNAVNSINGGAPVAHCGSSNALFGPLTSNDRV